MQNLYTPVSLLCSVGTHTSLVHLYLLQVPIPVTEKPQSFPLPH